MKVLLVEDDIGLGEALHAVLKLNQYDSTWVRTAEDAQRFLGSEKFDLHLFDIVLPGMSGLELLKNCRENDVDGPIMMLTARDGVTDRVIGLDGGADDYLAKPFAVEELLSRSRALLRRHLPQKTALWRVGALSIDTARRQVKLADEVLSLSKREYELLILLAQSPGKVLTRAQLAQGSDTQELGGSNAIDVHIYSLRKHLGANLISTVRGVGYALEERAT